MSSKSPPPNLSPLEMALILTAEVCSTKWSKAAAALVYEALRKYPEDLVLAALERCRSEVRWLSLVEILERIEDNRPSPNEAWAQVAGATEQVTIATTDEVLLAYQAVSRRISPAVPSLMESDPIAARVAFLEAYKGIVARNKLAGLFPRPEMSLGLDLEGRKHALQAGVERGFLTPDEAAVRGLLPPGEPLRLLPSHQGSQSRAEQAERNLSAIRGVLAHTVKLGEALATIERGAA